MRPPSYYASLSSSYTTSGGGSSSHLGNSSNNGSSSYSHPSSMSHLNRSSSSHQLRSSLSSPSSSSYVTRSHLPYVSQSMLVAHCFTGVSSSTKPNYGHHQSPANYSSSTYSTSYSRPKSLKRYEPSASSYLNPSSIGQSSSKYQSSSAYNSASRSNYLVSSSSPKPTYKLRPSPTSSYYPKPIRLRERPLLTQISRQLNTATSKPTSQPAYSNSSSRSNSKLTQFAHESNHSNDKSRTSEVPASGMKTDGTKLVSQSAKEEEEANWSSDVARNISRNKYLIKFREFEKRPSGPIQLTNRVEQQEQEEQKQDTSDSTSTAARPIDEADCLLRVASESETAETGENKEEAKVERAENHIHKTSVAMKVPLGESRQASYDDVGLETKKKPIEVTMMQEKPTVKAEVEPPIGLHDLGEPGKLGEEKSRRAPKEKRNIKLKIRNIDPNCSTQATATTNEPQQQEVRPKPAAIADRGEPLLEPHRVAAPADDGAQEATVTKPKVKRLVKTSDNKKAATPRSPAAKADLSPGHTVISLPIDDSDNKPMQRTKPAISNKDERRKSTPKVEQPDNVKQRKVLAPKVEQNKTELKQEAATTKQQPQQQPDTLVEPTKKSEVDTSARVAQENKRIRFREYHLDDFNFLSVLGHGGWGFVILAELKEHDACFAVKCIKKITIVEDDDFDSIMIERKMLTLGNVHPFICKLFCTFETEGYLFFVMEYCPGGDLMFHVQKDGKFTESRCRFYAAEIICAIRFLHNRHIIYRDLKLDNILLDSRGHIRLVDFGMCQCRTYREEMLPSNFCGTPEYISPEIIKGVPYNHSVDWWSFGVLLYEMAVGKMPFRGNDENELLWNVCYEQIHYPMFLTKELTFLLQSLLEREPTKRMGMATCKAGDIYDQAWFRGVDWAAIEEMRVPPPFVPEVNSKRDVQNFDADFTESKAELSPVDESTLQRIDQTQFQKFPYTNPDIFIFDSLCC